MPLWTCRLNEFVCAGFAVVAQVGELASSRVPGLPSMQLDTLHVASGLKVDDRAAASADAFVRPARELASGERGARIAGR